MTQGGHPGEAARQIASLVIAQASETERGGTVAGAVVDALHDHGLFRLFVPGCLGGREASSDVAFDVIETISHADGSTGWSFMAGAIYLGMAGGYFTDRGAAAVLDDPRAVAAGQAAPLGTATRSDSGWCAVGKFGFASGGRHATWFTGGFRELGRNGDPALEADGRTPVVVVGYFPRSSVLIHDNWSVMGLVGTGSIDYEIDQAQLTPDFSFSLFSPTQRRGHARLRLGLPGMTAIGHSAFACGVAGRLLDELAALALSKRRLGRKTLVDDPQFQSFFARARGRVGAAKAYALECIGVWEDAAVAGCISPEVRANGRLATSHATATAVDVAAEAFRFAGSTGLRNGSVIQRCFRDLNAGETHVFTDHNTFRDAGALLLGAGPDTLLR
jgi:alkylation response protein AidB-like acyl-CoA dehydrogenase